MLGRLAMGIAVFADPKEVAIWIVIAFSLRKLRHHFSLRSIIKHMHEVGELAVKFPISRPGVSWIRISAWVVDSLA